MSEFCAANINSAPSGLVVSKQVASKQAASDQAASDQLEELLKTQPALWRGRDQHNDYASIPTGYPQLDKVLPSGGWGIGYLTELLLEQHGIGEFSLLLPGLQQVTSENQWAALVNPPYLPYAPALANAGINLERLLIINTDNDADTLWATEQLLRAGIFAAVVSWGKPNQRSKTTPLAVGCRTRQNLGNRISTSPCTRPTLTRCTAHSGWQPGTQRIATTLTQHHKVTRW